LPLIEVKAFDRRFEDDAVAERLIAELTDAMCSVFGEEAREEIWVVVEGVSPSRWGFGGKVRS
jgi:4-oxalocrotonate tautomerase